MSWLETPPLIMCRRCKHPVERVTMFQDPAAFRLMIRVECHGETEEQPVPGHMLADKSITILAAEAFTPAKISHVRSLK